MQKLLLTAMIVISVLMILAVVIQPAKNSSSANITGSTEALGGRKKARGLEAAMDRVIRVLGVLFMVIAIALAKLAL
ncbi:MAG: preprotein translocase subunit SecG [Aerococcus sp.]|nr:preprotein translocase subunit SecG [Aerococcus sp.]